MHHTAAVTPAALAAVVLPRQGPGWAAHESNTRACAGPAEGFDMPVDKHTAISCRLHPVSP